MNSFVQNRFGRESIISSSSSSSEESVRSQFDKGLEKNGKENNQSNEKISCSENLLFLAPLIFFLILLISGIVIFLIVHENNEKDLEKEINLKEYFLPILCPISPSKKCQFLSNERDCALNRSSIIEIFYENSLSSIKAGEILRLENVINPPIIKFNWTFLSRISSKSFVLILVDLKKIELFDCQNTLHWIRYISSTSENGKDICSYQIESLTFRMNIEKIFFLYATNSTETIIRAKTICNKRAEEFQLEEYLPFFQLKLVASTHFFISTTKKQMENSFSQFVHLFRQHLR